MDLPRSEVVWWSKGMAELFEPVARIDFYRLSRFGQRSATTNL